MKSYSFPMHYQCSKSGGLNRYECFNGKTNDFTIALYEYFQMFNEEKNYLG